MTHDPYSEFGSRHGKKSAPKSKRVERLEEQGELRKQYKHLITKEEAEMRAMFPILDALDKSLSKVPVTGGNLFMKYVRKIAPALPEDPTARHWAVKILNRHCQRLRREQGLDPMNDPLPVEMGGTGSIFDLAKKVIDDHEHSETKVREGG